MLGTLDKAAELQTPAVMTAQQILILAANSAQKNRS